MNSSENCFKDVKENLLKIIGMPASIKAIRGRRRFVIKNCKICDVYDNIFIVSVQSDDGSTKNVSFSYADILTKTIVITVYKQKNVS